MNTFPEWLRRPWPSGDAFGATKDVVESHKLHTVCQSARSPNLGECWARGVATIMILGDVCTRSCGFCHVKTGRPPTLDVKEPERVAESVQQMKASVQEVQLALKPPDAILIGPRHLRAESRRFTETASGEMIWFNVCFTMFRRQEVFDMLLRPAIENAHVDSIQFIA